ncbi:molybdopterin-binding protein [Puniceibacterium confluentis]|uniref:molybdopterin-binding protein n=2 Tax=Puniceibacterium confluentis TaxID=1958944 RepID=UPI0011B6192A|nr:gephyrin-like molybdotransferase Glp [Puniceibacterium confluentis]
MSGFDRFLVVDWSGGNDTGPRARKDAIWIGEAGKAPQYLRNRMAAEDALSARIMAAEAAGERLFIGFDFPFAYPEGFAERLTGGRDPFAVWAWIAERLKDSPQSNNRFELAAEINDRFPGTGPFWFNGTRKDLPGLPRRDTRTGHGLPETRRAEQRAAGAFSCWQLGGRGAVGGQVLTGVPVLHRLRSRFGSRISVWPFEAPEAAVVLAEIWPGLINDVVRRAEGRGGIRDAHQVRLLSQALAQLAPEVLARMLAEVGPEAATEGWILGLGHEQTLQRAAESLQPPPLRNDCFALPAGVDWTPVDTALGLLQARLRPVTARTEVPVLQAGGLVLATDVLARRSNPPQPNTAVDGWGFDAAACGAGPQRLPVLEGRSAAGRPFAGTVPRGSAIRVLTGAELPTGVNTVVLDEDVTVGAGMIAFHGPLKPGANTRRAGEDVGIGAVALAAGRVLTAADLALAAAVGHGMLPVFEPLRVAVVSTGDELVEAGAAAGPGQIFDANRPMLLRMAERWGYVPVDMGRVADDRAALRRTLDRAARKADVILTSGGASAGDEDHVSALLRESGALQAWRIALKPGRPLALGMWNGVPVFGLPGNPVAALVCALVFARPAMGLLSGAGWSEPQGFDLPAAFEKRKKPGRREYLRARVRHGAVEIFASEGSGRISGLSWAEGLVEIADGAQDIRPGDRVRYIPYGSFGI